MKPSKPKKTTEAQKLSVQLSNQEMAKIDAMLKSHPWLKTRNQAAELLIKRQLKTNVPQIAVFLVGGEGTRLRPMTYELPKPLISFQGKALSDHLLDLLKKYGIKKVIFATGYMGEKISDYYGDGKKFGMSITCNKEKEFMGTGGAVKLAENLVNQTFICGNGDELKDVDIEEMYYLHKASGALATLALTRVEDPSAYGVADLKGTQILRFVEKPKKEEAPSNYINAGFYIMEPKVLSMIPADKFCSLEKDVFPKLAKMGKLQGYIFKGQWYDAGTLERYEKALKEWKGIS